MEDNENYKFTVEHPVTVKKVTIQILNGGISPTQENFELLAGQDFEALHIINSSKQGHLNITLSDGSNLLEVPAIYIAIQYPKETEKRKKSSGCGGCAQRRKEVEAIKQKERGKRKNGTN